MFNGEGFAVLGEKIDVLDPNKNEIPQFLGCKQTENLI